MAALRNGLHKVASLKEQWAGLPMPLEGESLVIEPSHPYAAGLAAIGRQDGDASQAGDFRVRSQFYCSRRRLDIVVLEKQDGRVVKGFVPAIHHLDHDLHTLGCSDAWGIEQESKALDLMGSLVRHRQFKQYLLTGSFIERSQRSGVSYLFRRLKPTVAMRAHEGSMQVLCALCLHPIAYYAGTWAGAMCPTDDVIAHLALMRGDEPMFWRRANQHPAWRPEAGLGS